MRARIVRETDGTIIRDSGRSSNVYMTKEEYEEGNRLFEVESLDPRPVVKTVKKGYTPIKQLRREYYTELQTKAYEEMQKNNQEPFNPVIKSETSPRPAKRAKSNDEPKNDITHTDNVILKDAPKITFAKRAEDLYNEHVDEKINDNDTENDVVNEEPVVDKDIDHIPLNESETTAEEPATEFDEEMEKSVFPELNNSNYFAGVDSNEDTDYSNYEPEEYNDDTGTDSYDEDQYADYYEEDRKAAKRAAKRVQKSKGKRYVPDADMNEY